MTTSIIEVPSRSLSSSVVLIWSLTSVVGQLIKVIDIDHHILAIETVMPLLLLRNSSTATSIALMMAPWLLHLTVPIAVAVFRIIALLAASFHRLYF